MRIRQQVNSSAWFSLVCGEIPAGRGANPASSAGFQRCKDFRRCRTRRVCSRGSQATRVRPTERNGGRLSGYRNSAQKHVWRARILSPTAGLAPTREMMRQARTSKVTVQRWQQRFMRAGIESLSHSKTQLSRIPLLSAKVCQARGLDPRRSAGRGESHRRRQLAPQSRPHRRRLANDGGRSRPPATRSCLCTRR